MSSKRVKKYRGPSRPIDPRYAPGVPKKKGPDTFLLALIGISTAFVLLIFVFVASQGNAGTTASTTTTTTNPASNAAAPTAVVQDTSAQATQTMVAFSTETAGLPRISVQEAKPKIDAGQVKVFDVREKSFYTTEHVKGSVNVPYTDAQTRLSEFPKTGEILLYCQ
ncbi:MAG: rhodanese-like domain-containing protein [Chloroflexia bacterium]